MLVHSGGMNGGHYYSYTRTQDRRWLKFDDDKARSRLCWPCCHCTMAAVTTCSLPEGAAPAERQAMVPRCIHSSAHIALLASVCAAMAVCVPWLLSMEWMQPV